MLCSTIKFQLVLQLIESGGANGNRANESRASEKMSGEQSVIFIQTLRISLKLIELFLQLISSGGENRNQASELELVKECLHLQISPIDLDGTFLSILPKDRDFKTYVQY